MHRVEAKNVTGEGVQLSLRADQGACVLLFCSLPNALALDGRIVRTER